MTPSAASEIAAEPTLRRSSPVTGLAFLVGLGLSGLALRPQVVAIGPLLPSIESSLKISHSIAGLLATIPVLCMGACAPLAPFVASALGMRGALAVSLALVSVFGIARALVPDAPLVLLLTVPIGIGMGLAGAVLPVIVKQTYRRRPGFATGVYSAGIMLGSTSAAAVAVPLAHLGGGWQFSLLVVSGATGAVAIISVGCARVDTAAPRIRPVSLPRRSGLAWRLVFGFVLMSFVFYGLNSWLPDVYVERGWSQTAAGELGAVLNAVTIPSAFGVSWLADHYGSRRCWLIGMAGLQLTGVAGVVLLPAEAWVWAVILGASVGPLFPLTMTLPLDAAVDPGEVAALTAMVLGGGYSLAAGAPLLLGAVRDLTGGFAAAMWALVGASALLVAVHTVLTPETCCDAPE